MVLIQYSKKKKKWNSANVDLFWYKYVELRQLDHLCGRIDLTKKIYFLFIIWIDNNNSDNNDKIDAKRTFKLDTL